MILNLLDDKEIGNSKASFFELHTLVSCLCVYFLVLGNQERNHRVLNLGRTTEGMQLNSLTLHISKWKCRGKATHQVHTAD